jgi:hypothetical protein
MVLADPAHKVEAMRWQDVCHRAIVVEYDDLPNHISEYPQQR